MGRSLEGLRLACYAFDAGFAKVGKVLKLSLCCSRKPPLSQRSQRATLELCSTQILAIAQRTLSLSATAVTTTCESNPDLLFHLLRQYAASASKRLGCNAFYAEAINSWQLVSHTLASSREPTRGLTLTYVLTEARVLGSLPSTVGPRPSTISTPLTITPSTT